jgi:hypothetical protein
LKILHQNPGLETASMVQIKTEYKISQQLLETVDEIIQLLYARKYFCH